MTKQTLSFKESAWDTFLRQQELFVPNWPQAQKNAFKKFTTDELIQFLEEQLNTDLGFPQLVEVCYVIYLLRENEDLKSENLLLGLLSTDCWILNCYVMESLSYRIAIASQKESILNEISNQSIEHKRKQIEQHCFQSLKHKNPIVRCIAINALKKMRTTYLEEILEILVKEQNPLVKAYILDAIVIIGLENQWDDKLIRKFGEFSEWQDNLLVWTVCEEVFRVIGGEVITQGLVEMILEGKNGERPIMNLGTRGIGSTAQEILVRYLSHDNSVMRAWARESLAYFIWQKPLPLIKLEMGGLIATLYTAIGSMENESRNSNQKLSSYKHIIIGLLYALGRSRTLMYFDWFMRDGNYMFRLLYEVYSEYVDRLVYPRDFYYVILVSNLAAIDRMDVLQEKNKLNDKYLMSMMEFLQQSENGLSKDELEELCFNKRPEEASKEDISKSIDRLFLHGLTICLESEDEDIIVNAIYALGEWGQVDTISALKSFAQDEREVMWFEGPWGKDPFWIMTNRYSRKGPTTESIASHANRAIAKIEARNKLGKNEFTAYSKPHNHVETKAEVVMGDLTYHIPTFSVVENMSKSGWRNFLEGDFYRNAMEEVEAFFLEAAREDKDTFMELGVYNYTDETNSSFRYPSSIEGTFFLYLKNLKKKIGEER
jgi:hypothetical protein